MSPRAAQAFLDKLKQLSPERIDEVTSYVEFLIMRARNGAASGFVDSAPSMTVASVDALSGALMAQIDSEMQGRRDVPRR
jgi:hypothetical protein